MLDKDPQPLKVPRKVDVSPGIQACIECLLPCHLCHKQLTAGNYIDVRYASTHVHADVIGM
jgi:hypothetical protein